MSSLKHAVKRRVHLEREAPGQGRSLERRKEWLAREKEYHEREKLVKKLEQKVRFANPEEFNFGMVKHKFVNGQFVAKDRESREKLSAEQVMKLKKVLDVEETKLARAVEREASILTAVEAARVAERQHLVFQDSSDEETEDESEDEKLPVIGVSGLKKGVPFKQSDVDRLQEDMLTAYQKRMARLTDLQSIGAKKRKVESLAAKPADQPLPFYKRKK